MTKRSIHALFGLLAAVLVSGAAFAAISTTVTVGAGETRALTTAENKNTVLFVLEDGATLTVPADISWIKCAIDVNATATLDATAVTGALGMGTMGPIYLRTLGGDGSKLIVKGKDALSFGHTTKGTSSGTNFPSFDADVAFVDASGNAYANPAGVTFVNALLIRRTPTSSPWCVQENATLALGGTNPLGLGATLDLGTAGYDLYVPIHPEGGIPYGKDLKTVITVGAGRALYVRGVSTGTGTGGWGRWSGTFKNDVTMNGTILFSQTDGITFSGALTGNGLICGENDDSLVYFTGTVDFDGELRGGVIRSVTFSKAARIGTLAAATATTVVMKDDLTVGRLSGDLVLTAASTGTLHVGTLATGATITIPESVRLRVDAIEANAAYVTLAGETGSYEIAGPASPTATAVPFILTYPAGDVDLTLGGRIETEKLPANVRKVTLAADCIWMPAAVYGNWQDKVAFWLDANVPSAMIFARDYFTGYEESKYYRSGTVGGSPLVYAWGDCRGESVAPYYLRNQRVGQTKSDFSSYGTSMLPALSTGTVNGSGRHYIDMSPSNSGASCVTNNSLRTAMLGMSVPSQFAIVVFGSQAGGGRALLANGTGAFNRSGYGNTAAKATQYNIATNAFETYVDGTSVDPTSTTFSGGWQIVSMKTDGKSVSGMGFGSTHTSERGCVNVAEVLVFNAVPTERERKAAEKYLSDKWDIAISHQGVPPLPQELTLSGTGKITLSADTTVHGTFAGDVCVNGFALTVAADGNLRDATPHGTGSITAGSYRQLPNSRNRGDFSGTMTPPPPGFVLLLQGGDK